MRSDTSGTTPAARCTETNAENLDDPAYLKIRDVIYRAAGLYHPVEKLYLLASGCARRMSAVKASTPAAYLEHLLTRRNQETELRLLLNEITIGETYMFRSPSQLLALRNIILPEILHAENTHSSRCLHVWSAGCSTGEEAYTLAMVLLEESGSLLPGWTFDILATDLNDNSLAAARLGVYGEYALRNTPAALRSKYFTAYDEKRQQVTEQLRSRIRFERVNLHDRDGMSLIQQMDVVFCCNVLIYFDAISKRQVIQNFYSNLMPGGYLFLGHAESLYQVDDRFHLIHLPGSIAYRKPLLSEHG